jgi:ABC-type multidrug transport system ATPase subunit
VGRLSLNDVSVSVSAAGSLSSAPRDLPDLARYLISAVTDVDTIKREILGNLSFDIDAGCLAVIGEEGAGKSALVAVLARVLRPTTGSVQLDGVDVFHARGSARRQLRREVQVCLDDVHGCFDPRLTLRQQFAMYAHAQALADAQGAAQRALEMVGLPTDVLDRRAADLNAGETRLAALARGLQAEPKLIVLDEPTRGLDPFAHGVVLRALAAQVARGLMVVATRDVSLARVIATKVAVLDGGRLVECDDADRVFYAPQHPTTQALVTAGRSAS